MTQLDYEQNFFGRTDILALLKRRVTDLKEGYRQNVTLLGNRYVGNSKILHHFISNIDDDFIIPIYLDLEDKNFTYLFSKFTLDLLNNFARNRKLPLHDDLNCLCESLADLIPSTVQVIRKIRSDLAKNKFSDCYLGLLALPEVLTNETNQFCLLVLDEFQCLERILDANVFQILGKKIMTQKKCLYVLASSFPGVAQKIISEKLSLLFGNFEIIKVEPFNLEVSQQFIHFCLGEIRIGVQMRNFLTDFTGGHPLYLTLICRELINLSAIHNQNEVYLPILSQSIENTIFDRWGVISRHFELMVQGLCSGKGNEINANILIAVSNGKHKCDEVLKNVAIKRSQLLQRFSRLIENGVIVKNGNFYYFRDKLFKYWIKYVYQKRLEGVVFFPHKQRRLFKDEFHRLVENFKASSRMDFPLRIVELLHCFGNESFDLNGRRYKLPLFKEIIPFKIKSENGMFFDVIKGRTDAGEWVIVTKKENLAEGDVQTVLGESKRRKIKPDRFLIISLSELDDVTRLKALQEKFWIWNEAELNTLLVLFDKPFILG